MEPNQSVEIHEEKHWDYASDRTSFQLSEHVSLLGNWDEVAQSVRSTLPNTLEDGFTDDSGLARLQLPSIISMPDPFPVSAASIALIDKARKIQTPSKDDVVALHRASAPRSLRSMKLELPLLKSDYESDCRKLMKNIIACRTPALADHRLPLEPIDTEKDEGLDFPKTAKQHADALIARISQERIDVSRETMIYLAKQLRVEWTEEEQSSLLYSQLSYKKNPGAEPFTPPVSPKLGTHEYWIPPEEACQVPIPSDPSSRLSSDIKAAEDAVFRENNDAWPLEISQEGPFSVSLDTVVPPSVPADEMPDFRHQRLEDLKLEVPLLPIESNSSTTPPVDMTKIIKSVPALSSDGTLQSEDTIDQRLITVLQDAETHTMRSIEQEKLVPLDTLSRVPIPLMDFTIPEPPWHHLSNDSKRLFKWIKESNPEAFKLPKWPTNKQMDARMVWIPISSSDARIPMSESIADDSGVLDALTALPPEEEVCTSEAFVWKRPGWAILREDEDDEEEDISPVFSGSKAPTDLMRLIKKKSTLFSNPKTAIEPVTKDSNTGMQPVIDPLPKPHQQGDTGETVLADDEQPALSKLLDNFLLLNAPKKRSLEQSSFLPGHEHTPALPEKKKPRTITELPIETRPEKALPADNAAPAPQIKLPSTPMRALISVSLPRAILHGLEKYLPGIELIDRDHNAHNESVWRAGSVCRSEVVSPLADEADITISPATGIILTTMVKVRQKPLPGTGKSVLCNHVEKVSLRHERTIVLVSEGNVEEVMVQMAPPMATALAEFQAFVQSVDNAILVVYVPGGPETLAKWAAALVCRHYSEAAAVSQYLIEEETCWELFLQRAGMNAYAAQVVSGMLQAPDEKTNTAQSGQYGLPAFIRMTQEERVTRFAPILGGRKVLDRVGQLLDAQWG
ncbi:Lysine acetyltransferase [Pleurostoma richardsiae]|uniref:Lysine acetyltransferase n=1 Tax=Pleurostoma richardsiae TaxID=41990 RepID=A0AA38REY5_9PEZI|nr:Lysine acetyltransferase [Pleurostoma richardsiae]